MLWQGYLNTNPLVGSSRYKVDWYSVISGLVKCGTNSLFSTLKKGYRQFIFFCILVTLLTRLYLGI